MRKQKGGHKSHSKKSRKRVFAFVVAMVAGVVLGMAGYFYYEFFFPNVSVAPKGDYLYIRTGSTKDDVVQQLEQSDFINDMYMLKRAMKRLGYGNKIYAGRFKITPGMGNRQIVHMLAGNMQSPVNLQLPSVRTKERFAGIVARQIEPDSADIVAAMNDELLAAQYGFTTETFACLFLSNTYQMYWNVSLTDFLDRMYKEWNTFWASNDREAKLGRTQLTKTEVVILASIVSEETANFGEMPTIAGVYINRLRKGIRLQADPTVRYALGNFSVHRILTTHTQRENPYNTYKVFGLPPGPIAIPSTRHIDAVLDYEQHEYLFFCAKEDFSGTHNFSKTYWQHLAYARKYQTALNQRKIFK